MGQACSDEGVGSQFEIAHDKARWAVCTEALRDLGGVTSISKLRERMSAYEVAQLRSNTPMNLSNPQAEINLQGLQGALSGGGGGDDVTSAFFERTLPSMVSSALR